MLDLEKKYILSEDIVLRNVGKTYWGLNTKSGDQFKLNEVSYFILDQFRKQLTVKELLVILLKEFDVTEEVITEDVDKIISVATKNDLLRAM
jgi:hypothetical protein